MAIPNFFAMKKIMCLLVCCFLGLTLACNTAKNGGENNRNTPATPNGSQNDIPLPARDPNPPADYVPPPPPPPPLTNVGKDCVDKSKVKNPNEDCTFLWDPVCGCNNVTYENECLARKAGVLKWKKGKCQ